ncbi:AfsR/SARP family transcriptional regulator [Streptomyces sp. NBC_01294]|uniref:AfsR/SARP family transcriptional regulator n=1 Tax=Streptomyces sp. NBC_01294 TaxID=2903815 RepID=UPI002DD86771|nr:BTAD domain-containing putative transcriptional regulator [Streptomyces sp. NBC_01294]WRZ56511.1 tetratricopeptide repeat protein [Streptomyces sp. NBC_01294]
MSDIVFRLLGALDVQIDGRIVTLGSSRQRTVLTTLLLARNRVVSVERLIATVWQGNEPATARNQIAILVGALRRLFKDAAGADDLIVTSHPGYIMTLSTHQLDIATFEERASRAREAARQGQPAEACKHIDEALSLWRGRALEGIVGEPAESAATRLEELRLDLLEERAGLQLQFGRHRALIGELTALVREHPLREQSRSWLMLAEYRSGNRARALEIFREGRAILVDRLGLEPGPGLRSIHDLILQDAPELAPPPGLPSPAAMAAVPAQLPASVAAFASREEELGSLDRLLDESHGARPPAIGSISGVSGVGKTALAVHWANQAAAGFPDGQLFINLRGYHETDEPVLPEAALDRLLHSLGVPGARIPADLGDRAALYRSVLENKRMLILLDDARSFEQIRPLLPGTGRCCVLITSRDPIDDLTGDFAIRRINLRVLEQDAATALLAQVAGPERFAADPEAAARLSELCDRLPLALRIAGTRLAARPHWTLRSLVERLECERRRLDELSPGQGGIRAGLRLTYRHLPPAAARMFRCLGLLKVPEFASWVGAALLDTELWEAEDLIEQLVDAQLLEVARHRAGHPPRYRFHNLPHLYARELALAEDGEDEQNAALRRAFGGWVTLADEAHRRAEGGTTPHIAPVGRHDLPRSLLDELLGTPMDWFETERQALVAVVAQAAQSDAVSNLAMFSWSLTACATPVFETRHYLDDWRRCAEQSLVAARRAGSAMGEAAMLRSLGSLAINQRRYPSARESLMPALELFRQAGDAHGSAQVLRLLAICAHFRSDLAHAARYVEEAMDVFVRLGDVREAAHAMGLFAQIEVERGNLARGVELSERAVAKSREGGLWRAEAQSLHWLAEVLLRSGEPGRAAAASRRVVKLTQEGGDRVGETYALRALGDALWRTGEFVESHSVLGRAREIADELADDFLIARIEADLGCLDAVAGDPAAARRIGGALNTFTALGAKVWRDRTERLLRAVEAAEPGAPVPAATLAGLLEEPGDRSARPVR